MAARLSFDKTRQLGQSFNAAIEGRHINRDVLTGWAGSDHDRQTFLRGTVWGQIRWQAGLGRPNGPNLHTGFRAAHRAWDPEYVFSPGGTFDKGHWEPQADVSLYDAPDEQDEHVVGFVCRSVMMGKNTVAVTFTPGHHWTTVNRPLAAGLPLALSIQPAGRDWDPIEEWVFLEPVRIV